MTGHQGSTKQCINWMQKNLKNVLEVMTELQILEIGYFLHEMLFLPIPSASSKIILYNQIWIQNYLGFIPKVGT